MQLKVIKADGSLEEYLHTKVMGTISTALGGIGKADLYVAEPLAEVVTYYLYHEKRAPEVTSSEIFYIISAVLTAAGYEEAATVLSEHHFERRLKRRRIEVVRVDIDELADAQLLCEPHGRTGTSLWDKSKIVEYLMKRHTLSPNMARTIASMVEEKIFSMDIRLVPVSLIRQLVLGDTAAILHAERQLQTV